MFRVSLFPKAHQAAAAGIIAPVRGPSPADGVAVAAASEKFNREVDAALSKYQWNANLVAFKDTVQRPRSGLPSRRTTAPLEPAAIIIHVAPLRRGDGDDVAATYPIPSSSEGGGIGGTFVKPSADVPHAATGAFGEPMAAPDELATPEPSNRCECDGKSSAFNRGAADASLRAGVEARVAR
jgi:hypothetical protein